VPRLYKVLSVLKDDLNIFPHVSRHDRCL
jgi:hypothetical protein